MRAMLVALHASGGGACVQASILQFIASMFSNAYTSGVEDNAMRNLYNLVRWDTVMSPGTAPPPSSPLPTANQSLPRPMLSNISASDRTILTQVMVDVVRDLLVFQKQTGMCKDQTLASFMAEKVVFVKMATEQLRRDIAAALQQKQRLLGAVQKYARSIRAVKLETLTRFGQKNTCGRAQKWHIGRWYVVTIGMLVVFFGMSCLGYLLNLLYMDQTTAGNRISFVEGLLSHYIKDAHRRELVVKSMTLGWVTKPRGSWVMDPYKVPPNWNVWLRQLYSRTKGALLVRAVTTSVTSSGAILGRLSQLTRKFRDLPAVIFLAVFIAKFSSIPGFSLPSLSEMLPWLKGAAATSYVDLATTVLRGACNLVPKTIRNHASYARSRTLNRVTRWAYGYNTNARSKLNTLNSFVKKTQNSQNARNAAIIPTRRSKVSRRRTTPQTSGA